MSKRSRRLRHQSKKAARVERAKAEAAVRLLKGQSDWKTLADIFADVPSMPQHHLDRLFARWRAGHP